MLILFLQLISIRQHNSVTIQSIVILKPQSTAGPSGILMEDTLGPTDFNEILLL